MTVFQWIKYQNVNGQMFENHHYGTIQSSPEVHFLIHGDCELDDPTFAYMDENKTMIRFPEGLGNGLKMPIKGKMMNISEKTAQMFAIPFSEESVKPNFKIEKMNQNPSGFAHQVYKITSTVSQHRLFYFIFQV